MVNMPSVKRSTLVSYGSDYSRMASSIVGTEKCGTATKKDDKGASRVDQRN